jgi:glycosyltransferase involved in cell wall biosynthesis
MSRIPTLTTKTKTVSVVIPAKNESDALDSLIQNIRALLPNAEIIVVDDGSTDDTAKIGERHPVRLIRHPYSVGNGAAVKSGARAASGDVLVFLDGDGQHNPQDIPALLEKLEEGYDMVVGARVAASQASVGRLFANSLYNRLASWVVGHDIPDLTSGFRAVKSHLFKDFLHLLPNGFSYPTTITMCFFRAGYIVSYVPIRASARTGKSHIRPIRDGVRFFLIIFKVGTLYSPLKIFLPISLCFFVTGLSYYLYTFTLYQRFTNMSALLLITSILVFLIGLVSEQITALHFRDTEK